MAPDQQLQEAARAMALAADAGKSVASVLKKHCSHVYPQIVRDRKYPGLLALWGRSVNVDEIADQIIVHPAILEAIGIVAGVPMHGPGFHAGLLHTYGYLFSTLATPYGLKRERWLSTQMEQGFGIDLSLLSDRPKAGTLLANLTWMLGQLVFRDRPSLLRRLAPSAPAVAPSLVNYDYGAIAHPGWRLVERVPASKSRPEIALITDFVPYPHRPTSPNGEDTLLVYSVQNGVRSSPKLITAFPVRTDLVEELRNSASTSRLVEIRPRYNAYVPGLSGRLVRGRRQIQRLSI